MKRIGKTIRTKIFVSVLVLAILSSLTGHVFLHLADEPFHQESSQHISVHHEDSAAQNQNHQCSICLDHQALSLDLPTSNFEFSATTSAQISSQRETNYDAKKILFSSDRAPPRS